MPRLAINKLLDIKSSIEAIARDEPDGRVKKKALQIRRILKATERGSVVEQAIGVAEDTNRTDAVREEALDLLLTIALAERLG